MEMENFLKKNFNNIGGPAVSQNHKLRQYIHQLDDQTKPRPSHYRPSKISKHSFEDLHNKRRNSKTSKADEIYPVPKEHQDLAAEDEKLRQLNQKETKTNGDDGDSEYGHVLKKKGKSNLILVTVDFFHEGTDGSG